MPSSPVILFRPIPHSEEEESSARSLFPVVRYRSEVPPGSLVVPRYSALPFYNELAHDTEVLGSKLVNSLREHLYVSNFDYYEDLQDLTFPTWFRFEDVPTSFRGSSFVVKGRTNSRKFEWAQKMFAKDFPSAVRIGAELATDGLIGQQGVLVRQFVELETFEVSVTGTPLTNEWRVFYYRGQRLAHGYYWGNIDDWAPVEGARPDFLANGLPFADEVAHRVRDKVPFVVVDIAKTAQGAWRLVELNDGSQSGLNGVIEASELYAALKLAL